MAEFVQKTIRYVAVEIGIGGYQPHFAQETFRNQYGDCKDKVTLFRSLMKALNRDVYPVLINAERGVRNSLRAASRRLRQNRNGC